MPMVSVFAISAPVERTDKPAREGNVILKAEYTALGLYQSWEDAIEVAVPMVEERFNDKAYSGYVTIVTKSNNGLKEVGLGYTQYAPLGVTEIPLLVCTTHSMDIDLESMSKFFEVPLDILKE